MTKKTRPAPVGGATYDADKLETLTLKLLAPIEHKGERIETITLTEPRAFDSVKAEAAAARGGHRVNHLMIEISDLPPGAELRARDIGRISQWLGDLTRGALEIDGLAQASAIEGDAAEADPFAVDTPVDEAIETAGAMDDAAIDALEGERTFALCVPFEFGGRKIETLTATEPTIDAMLAGEKHSLVAQQTIAMIAAVTGESIQVITRLALRDLNRIEVWLAPFVRDVMSQSTGGA